MQALGFLMVRVPCMAIRREELQNDYGGIGGGSQSVQGKSEVLGTCSVIQGVLVVDNPAERE